jgi:hypothetical protein
LLLGVVAYNLGTLLRQLVLPLAIQSWSLTSLQQGLFKTGRRLIRPRAPRPTPWAWACWGFTGSSRAPMGCTFTVPIHTAHLLKNFGIKDEDEVVTPGINGKMSEP